MKTVYYTDHKNIQGNQLITVNEWKDIFGKISYQVQLEEKDWRQTLKMYKDKYRAMNFADNYKTV